MSHHAIILRNMFKLAQVAQSVDASSSDQRAAKERHLRKQAKAADHVAEPTALNGIIKGAALLSEVAVPGTLAFSRHN
jgi:hypothetical protein